MAITTRRTWRETAKTPAANSVAFQLVAEDANRIYLGIFVVQSGLTVQYSTNPGLAVNTGAALAMNTQVGWVQEYFREFTPLLVQQAWYAVVQSWVSGAAVVIMEELEYDTDAPERTTQPGTMTDVDMQGVTPVGDVVGPDPLHGPISDLVRTRRQMGDCGQCKP